MTNLVAKINELELMLNSNDERVNKSEVEKAINFLKLALNPKVSQEFFSALSENRTLAI